MGLRQRRKAAGLNQAELARRVGCNGNYISQIEVGRFSARADVASRIDEVLGVGQEVVKVERTEEEKWFHELWIEKYG